MNRAAPQDLRIAIAAANAYVSAGVLFVPMPVSTAAEQAARVEEATNRLAEMIKETEMPFPDKSGKPCSFPNCDCPFDAPADLTFNANGCPKKGRAA